MSSILWLTWKDHQHPQAGGAEIIARELTARLRREGHQVTMLTCGYEDAPAIGKLPADVDVIRVGTSRYTHSFKALFHYLRHFRGKFDILIEEVNGGAPYFSILFEPGKTRKFLLYHQLARKNWFYEIRAPFSHIGYYFMVPIACRLASWSRTPVVTVSESTRQVLAKHGFRPDKTHIISEGIEIQPLLSLKDSKKFTRPTLLSLGSMRAMKRTLDQVKAFEFAKAHIPDLRLKLAGSAATDYGQQVLGYIRGSSHKNDIEYLGKVSLADKIRLMQKSHLTLQTAVEEGWGLTITEAASQGTPAIAYDVDGLRDSVRHGRTGLVTPQSPEALSQSIVTLLKNHSLYQRMREAAWQWSKQITFDQSYRDFKKVLELT